MDRATESFSPAISPDRLLESFLADHCLDTNAEIQNTDWCGIEQCVPDVAVTRAEEIFAHLPVLPDVDVTPVEESFAHVPVLPDVAETSVQESFEDVQALTKRRKKASTVWDTFDKVKEVNGTEWAKCKHCEKKYRASSKTGTSNLLKHKEKCRNKKNGDREKPSKMIGSSAPALNKEKDVFDQERGWMSFARMIIKKWYPLSMIAKDFSENSKNSSLKADILYIYKEEKENLYQSFNKQSSSHFNLTINLWRTGAAAMYCCLTLQFIDDDWELRKKVLAFKRKEFNNKYWELYGTFKSMLLDWSIGKNLLSITAQNTEETDKIVDELKNWLAYQDSLSFHGKLLHVNCFVHALNLLVEDGLQEAKCVLCKIMQCISYVRNTPEKDCNFRKAVHNLRSQGKKVTSEDMPVNWDFSFQILEGTLDLRETFSLLQVNDLNFSRLNPERKEWDKVTLVYQCLKVLDEATQSFSASRCLSANVYFPMVCNVYWNLCQWTGSVDIDICLMASKMKEKFEKYWENWSEVLAIAVVLDPRFKFDIVEQWYNKLYVHDAEGHCRRIRDTLTRVYNKYVNHSKNSTSSSYVTGHCHMLDSLGLPCTSSHDADDGKSQKAELVKYLEEPKFPPVEDFDILGWWRVNRLIFPTLAKMARDFLAIPVLAAQSNPSFNESIMKIVSASTELEPEIMEALICSKEWS